jgi:hypothetical protein
LSKGRQHPASFRDPNGFVFTRGGSIYRQVNKPHRDAYHRLMDSGLYQRLVDERLMLPHEPVSMSLALDENAVAVLQPETVPFISYPYEWCFGQLKSAALATLKIQKISLDYGMSLRDASAFNIQFVHGAPSLIDLTSLGLYPAGSPWVAYRQFCQHFLAPLALMAGCDLRLGAMLACHLDGIPLDLASRMLGGRGRLRPGLLMHLHLHSKTRTSASQGEDRPPRQFTEHAMRGLVEGLISTVEATSCDLPKSGWVAYEAGKDVYNRAAIEHKMRLVRDLMERHRPRVVWDFGANTGDYSLIAAESAELVVSLDFDAAAVERLYRTVEKSGQTNLVPLVCDLTNPTPALGWANGERSSLIERGRADLGMALALVHHLAIGANIPFGHMADLFASTCRQLIIEFVPRSDPMVDALLAFREDVFGWYDEANFEASFKDRFTISEKEQLADSGRTIYFMTRL